MINGNRYILDTNAVISLLNGNASLSDMLQKSTWIGVSIITKLELFSFPRITSRETLLIHKFLRKIDIINITNDDEEYIKNIIRYRKDYHLKLPDAIIAATVILTKGTLITYDSAFTRIHDMKTLSP